MSSTVEAARPGIDAAAPPRPAARGRRLVLPVLGVLATVAALVVAIPRPSGDVVREIGYASELASVRASAPFAVAAPQGLPAGWRATGVRIDRRNGTTHWHLAFATPSGAYASVEQSNRLPVVFVGEMTERGPLRGSKLVGTELWNRSYAQLRDHRAFWRTRAGVSTVVGGTASWDELEVLVESLTYAGGQVGGPRGAVISAG
ncbi:DUF4245 domain-containing protein [Motilibacter deserti]|uniref:DUF4245 domain-containing protein n=1 Tax=Motilibacter deserti TaxID=2714956 RepID=A0ABX0GYY1_9ACTN|nr:DUF4245 domain-containing protein [Motilibacter deserti]